jgi:hypothetical protein
VRVGLGLLEERQEVPEGIPEMGGDVPEHADVQLAQHVFEGHHRHRLGVAGGGDALGDEPVREIALGVVHVPQRKAPSPGLRKEVPVCAVGVVDRDDDPGPLGGVEVVEQRHRREGDGGGVEVAVDRAVAGWVDDLTVGGALRPIEPGHGVTFVLITSMLAGIDVSLCTVRVVPVSKCAESIGPSTTRVPSLPNVSAPSVTTYTVSQGWAASPASAPGAYRDRTTVTPSVGVRSPPQRRSGLTPW